MIHNLFGSYYYLNVTGFKNNYEQEYLCILLGRIVSMESKVLKYVNSYACALVCSYLYAVSYTHLDVYKRQN